MSDQLKPGDLIIWAAKNGTVRHGKVLSLETIALPAGPVNRWFVEIDSDSTLPGGDGFRTWFRSEDLIKVSGNSR